MLPYRQRKIKTNFRGFANVGTSTRNMVYTSADNCGKRQAAMQLLEYYHSRGHKFAHSKFRTECARAPHFTSCRSSQCMNPATVTNAATIFVAVLRFKSFDIEGIFSALRQHRMTWRLTNAFIQHTNGLLFLGPNFGAIPIRASYVQSPMASNVTAWQTENREIIRDTLIYYLQLIWVRCTLWALCAFSRLIWLNGARL